MTKLGPGLMAPIKSAVRIAAIAVDGDMAAFL
jgi:hypothetical protein